MDRVRVGALLLTLFLLAIILLVAGAQGSFGRLLCVIFAPGRLAIRDESQRSGAVHAAVQAVTPAGGA